MGPKGARDYNEIAESSTEFPPLFASVRKYHEVIWLLVLVGAAAVTFFAHSKDPDQQGAILGDLTRSVLAVEAPIERGVTSAIGFGIDTWKGYVDLRHVRQENLRLRQK